MAGMIETPVVCVDVQRAGPATGVPTKTEQGDLWQVLGAGQGDYPRIIVAPADQLDVFQHHPRAVQPRATFTNARAWSWPTCSFPKAPRSVDPGELDFRPEIDRGELIFPNGGFRAIPSAAPTTTPICATSTPRAASRPRAVPGVPGHIHVAATDEHDEDGTLISDEFTNPAKRRLMVEKRARKMESVLSRIAPPETGRPRKRRRHPGWLGFDRGRHSRGGRKAGAEEGIVANQLAMKWLVPFHAEEITRILSRSKRVIIIENNHSGQFARYLRSETGIAAHGHIRKYDGEPFMPHHLVNAVKEQLAGKSKLSVPQHEIHV